MGGAPYIGPRLGGGPIFEVLVSHSDAKERLVSYPSYLYNLNSSSSYRIDFSLIQARLPIQSKGSRDTSLCVVEYSCIKWA